MISVRRSVTRAGAGALFIAGLAILAFFSLRPTIGTDRRPADGAQQPIAEIADFRSTEAELTWRDLGGTERRFVIDQLRRAIPDDLWTSYRHRFSRTELAPSGDLVAFEVRSLAGEGVVAWHIGVVTGHAELIGLYSVEADCYLYEYVWTPDATAIVARLAPCHRVIVLDRRAAPRADILTQRSKGALYASPDSQWVAIDDGPSAGSQRRIEFISLRDPAVRYERNATALGELGGWRRPTN